MRRSILMLGCSAVVAAFACGNSPTGADNSAWLNQGNQRNDAGQGEGGGAQASFTCSQFCVSSCSEADVVAIVSAFNRAEISISQAVLPRLQSPSLKDFAQRMITEHTQLENQLQMFASQSGTQANQQNLIALSITLEAQRFVTDLQSGMLPGQNGTQPGGTQPGGNQPGGNQPGGNQPGGNQPGGSQGGQSQLSAIDAAYWTIMFTSHVAALGTIEHLVIPSAMSPQGIELAQVARVAVGSHITVLLGIETQFGLRCGGVSSTCSSSDAGSDSSQGDGGLSAR